VTEKHFWKPSVVQDFGIMITADDIKDGKLTEPAVKLLTEALINYTYRFLPQVSPGKSIDIDIRMETER
jgi:hypothetical protein